MLAARRASRCGTCWANRRHPLRRCSIPRRATTSRSRGRSPRARPTADAGRSSTRRWPSTRCPAVCRTRRPGAARARAALPLARAGAGHHQLRARRRRGLDADLRRLRWAGLASFRAGRAAHARRGTGQAAGRARAAGHRLRRPDGVRHCLAARRRGGRHSRGEPVGRHAAVSAGRQSGGRVGAAAGRRQSHPAAHRHGQADGSADSFLHDVEAALEEHPELAEQLKEMLEAEEGDDDEETASACTGARVGRAPTRIARPRRAARPAERQVARRRRREVPAPGRGTTRARRQRGGPVV